MKRLIHFTLPLSLAIAALISLFFQLPSGPSLCKACQPKSPLLSLFGAGYFAALISAILLFPSNPKKWLKILGIVFSLSLALSLTAMQTALCIPCLTANTCHVLIWIFWSPRSTANEIQLEIKTTTLIMSFFAGASFFGALNANLALYGAPKLLTKRLVQEGEKVKLPITLERDTAFHFVVDPCPFCEEQLKNFENIKTDLSLLNVSTNEKAKENAPHLAWEIKKAKELEKRFGIQGYPTLILVNQKGEILKVKEGLQDSLEVIFQER